MATKYPPYVNAYGNISSLFEEIKKASVPPKFTQDFLSTMLGLKSSSYRAMIPLLKRLGFIDQGNMPTQAYRDYRDDNQSGQVMASQLKSAYSDLYRASEYAHKLTRQQLISKLKTLTGASAEDKVIPAVAGTFEELAKLADFESASSSVESEVVSSPEKQEDYSSRNEERQHFHKNFGISYTINLNLPATTEVEVFNAIFKSLKEHILND